ncbi:MULTISPECIES: DNA repair protein RecO [Dyella]|uniref:DNA repair protein RecO n=2 Tax=Dyella TaxID=231454 RepID=A0A4V2NMC5_9GAMM|nr:MULTISPECIES: DNA repair protein RecO [Dyella]TBR39661.1 DNA repair protein RecO [Dyella terrae]TCI12757.1 DNA repair protein RecO [Dyella soli]
MRVQQQPAFVLHARPYRETSMLLECLTPEFGRIGVVARGVRREKARLQRSQLEPFQRLSLDLMLKGELAALQGAESVGPGVRLEGQAGLAGLYVNELVVRLTVRQDPMPDLFEAYATLLARLGSSESQAWTLRRFERDLLDVCGYALQLEFEGESGEPIAPGLHYRYHAELGATPCRADVPHALRGSDLLALGSDQAPDTVGLSALRSMMRDVIRFHLGGAELRAWRVLGAAVRR